MTTPIETTAAAAASSGMTVIQATIVLSIALLILLCALYIGLAPVRRAAARRGEEMIATVGGQSAFRETRHQSTGYPGFLDEPYSGRTVRSSKQPATPMSTRLAYADYDDDTVTSSITSFSSSSYSSSSSCSSSSYDSGSSYDGGGGCSGGGD